MPNDYRSAIFEAEMFDKGITPATGGLYDQDNWFIEFSKLFIAYRNQMQNEG